MNQPDQYYIYSLLLEQYATDLELQDIMNIMKRIMDDNKTTPWKPIYPEPYNTCPKCGIKLDGVMGYCCPTPHCPTGLGPVIC